MAKMPQTNIVNLPVTVSPSEDADTERKRRLFAWADEVLKNLGLDAAVKAAKSLEALSRITVDMTSRLIQSD
jgi:hypothetical protein